MAQTNCSQATAFLCLKQANGDVIDALLAVSSHEEENRVEEEGSSIEVPEKTLDDNAELIMAASSCSKETALKALEKYDGDVVNALLGLQELSEGSLTEDLSLSTEKQTDRRILILEELNASEQTYCNGMSHLQTYFIYEILTWSENGEKEIFAAFKSVNIMLMKVIALNMPMAERFNSCLEEYRENGTALIGPAFEGIERFGEDYSNYIEFTQQLFKNMDMWEKNNAAFIAIVKELNNKAKQDKLLDLRSYLIMPVQRCPRYLLFLKDLARSTPTEHADFKHIKDAHTKTEMVNRAINRHLQDASNSMKMKELSKQFATDPNLISPHRKLLKEGLFQKKCEKNSKKKSRKIFLFNDMLAYAKPFGSKFKLCEKFPLRGVRVEEDPEATEDCAFMIRTPAKNFTFFADSMEEKMEWMLGITVKREIEKKQFSLLTVSCLVECCSGAQNESRNKQLFGEQWQQKPNDWQKKKGRRKEVTSRCEPHLFLHEKGRRHVCQNS